MAIEEAQIIYIEWHCNNVLETWELVLINS